MPRNVAAVIVAGGQGTRMGPDAPPKAMTDIGGKPLLEHQLLRLKAAGAQGAHLCLGYKSGVIMDYFSRKNSLKMDLHYHVEKTPRGTAGCVKDLAAAGVAEDEMLVIYGDLFVDMDFGKLLDFHARHEGDATLAVAQTDHPQDSDLVRLDGDRIAGFYRARPGVPPQDNWAAAAVWVLRRPILDLVPAEGAVDFGKDVFPEALKRGRALYAYRTQEPLWDLGTPERLEAFLKRRGRNGAPA